MVLLSPTNALRSAVGEYNKLPSHYRGKSIDEVPLVSIDHKSIVKISEALLNYSCEGAHELDTVREGYTLDNLLQGCSVYVAPKPPKLEPTEEYKKLMADLRRQNELASYKALLSGSGRFVEQTEEDEYTLKDLNADLSMIANVLLTTLGTAGAVWAVSSSWDTPGRFAMAFTSSLVVCLAEVVVLGGYYRRINEAKEMERKSLETKDIVRTWVIGKGGQ